MSKKQESKQKAAERVLVNMFETIKTNVILTLSAMIDNDRRLNAVERMAAAA